MKVVIDLAPREVDALKLFVETQPGPRVSGREAAHRLLTDALMACGCLPLGKANRSRHAGGRRRT